MDMRPEELSRLREAYDRHAAERETMVKQDWKARERERFAGLLEKGGGQRLLEIGPGPGHDSLYFKERGFRVSCADLSEEMVKLCRQKGLDARQMDFSQLGFQEETFDAVYGMNCLLHVPKGRLSAVLDEIRRVLKPAGLFYWGVWGGEDSEGIWEKDSYEPQRFFSFHTDEGILAAAAQGRFELVDFHTVPVEGSHLHVQSLTLRKGMN